MTDERHRVRVAPRSEQEGRPDRFVTVISADPTVASTTHRAERRYHATNGSKSAHRLSDVVEQGARNPFPRRRRTDPLEETTRYLNVMTLVRGFHCREELLLGLQQMAHRKCARRGTQWTSTCCPPETTCEVAWQRQCTTDPAHARRALG